jgi:UDP-N-acetylmuramate dehydrogenase
MIVSEPAPVCVEDAPLAPLTSFGLGGRARVLATVSSSEQLGGLLSWAHETDLPVYVLGGGANVLVSDDGVDGLVVRLKGGAFDEIRWNGPRVTAGAGADMAKLTLASVRRDLSGLECMAGIPGTVGGCIRMNAGGKFGEIGSVVRRVWTVDRSGCRREWKQEELGFRYRGCALRDEIIERAELELTPAEAGRAVARYREVWAYKRQSQPLAGDSAGCIFKNPPGISAGALIDRAGLKGTSVGGAAVSQEHANFIVASDGASASDVIKLIDTVRRRVKECFGVQLELEVNVWGSTE